ncbi:MAG: adenylyltransferase/cytidyltransferase family protein [Erysipelotrichaceae bacterium]
MSKRGSVHRIIDLRFPIQNEVKPYRVGYTAGVFDLFHKGHRKHLENAKGLCESLIVGVNSDELTLNYRNIRPRESQTARIDHLMRSGYAAMSYRSRTWTKRSHTKNITSMSCWSMTTGKGHPRWEATEKQMVDPGSMWSIFPILKGFL